MIKIGIIPNGYFYKDNNPFNDIAIFVNNYFKKVKECNAYPIALFPLNEMYSENDLSICDGFIICGGSYVNPYHLGVIKYALQNNKPLLGICLGMQALGVYSIYEKEINKHYDDYQYLKDLLIEDKIDNFKEIKENNLKLHDHTLNNDIIDHSLHKIILDKESILYNIFKKDTMVVPSFHKHNITYIKGNYIIDCKSEDGIIEGIEYNDKNYFIIGLQWHPELKEEYIDVFKRLIKECEKRN